MTDRCPNCGACRHCGAPAPMSLPVGPFIIPTTFPWPSTPLPPPIPNTFPTTGDPIPGTVTIC